MNIVSILLDMNLEQEFKSIRREFSFIEAMFYYSIDIHRGSEKSISQYSTIWSWSRNKVRRFLQDIKKPSGFKKDSKRTGKGHPIFFIDKVVKTKKDSKRTGKGQATATLPPKKQGFKPPTIKQAEQYFYENGYTKESGSAAWKYYDTGKWKDTNGKPVLNWKQKMRGVWFKDENRREQAVSAENKEKALDGFRNTNSITLKELAAGGNVYAFEVLRERGVAI